MKRFHPLSFGLGLASGLIVVVIVAAGFRALHPASTFARNGTFQGGAGNISRMAQRMGMTQDELQKELDSGKTMQQIAQEHGVQFGGSSRRNGGSFGGANGTGSTAVRTGSGQAPVTASSSPAAQ